MAGVLCDVDHIRPNNNIGSLRHIWASQMTQNTTFSTYAESIHYDLKELLVAYDFSQAAESSLKYAVMLSKRFGSFIHLIGVQTPADYSSALEAGPLAVKTSQRDLQFGLQEVEEHLRAKGIWSDSVRRIGNISDALEGVILEHTPDLLLLGAYGYGPIDRPQLGSTAEHLLRTVRCPVLVVGPNALLREHEAPPIERILYPTSSLDLPDNIFCFAGHLVGQMGAHLELVYVVDPTQKDMRHKHHEKGCEEWTTELRERGVKVTWTVLYGRADTMLAQHATELKASLILFGLHRSGNHMIDCPDGVVSGTIRQAPCPVITVPPALPHMR
jgi:nucleotide-binding universal stress UspA family protein